MPYVYSTLANDQRYTTWVAGQGMNSKQHEVYVAGGYGINKSNGRMGIVTPDGAVVTEISDLDLEQLKLNPDFLLHEKNGHVRVVTKQVKVEKITADLNLEDQSKPYTPQDAEKDNVTPSEE